MLFKRGHCFSAHYFKSFSADLLGNAQGAVKSVASLIQKEEIEIEPFSKKANLKIVLMCLVNLCVVSLGVSCVLYLKGVLWEPFNIGIAISIGYWLVLTFALVKTSNAQLVSQLLNMQLYLYIPYRVYGTGGVLFTALWAYMAHAIFVYSINGKKQGVATLVYGVLSISLWTLPSLQSAAASTSEGFPGIAILLSLLNSLFPVIFVLEEKAKLVSEIQKLQARRSSQLILEKITKGAIENLKIAKNAVERSRSEKNTIKLSEAQLACARVDELIKKVSEEADIALHDYDIGKGA